MRPNCGIMLYKLRKFIAPMNFANAIKVTLAAAIPVIVFSYFDLFQIGFTVALGAFLTYPSDISSNLQHKINGILSAIFIVAGSAFVISICYPLKWLFYPLFAAVVFLLSMISVYGQRATLVSFSGLLSISLVFANVYQGKALVIHCLLLLCGGLFYLVVSLAFYYLRPHRYAELQIADCVRLTSKYLKLRGDLWTQGSNRTMIIEQQLHLQVELNTIHENIRETLIRNRSGAGSSAQNRKMLIVFISLVEILELALATAFDHETLHKKFAGHNKVLETYQNLAYNLAATLKKLSVSAENRIRSLRTHNLFDDLNALEIAIKDYEQELGADASEGVYMLTTMLHYAEKQVEKINIVERAFTLAVFKHDFKGADKDLEKFLTPQYYPISILLENLCFSSTIFRHSLRLTVTILAGFIIGNFLPLQNSYWILLTIVVIMRPGYGLTKERSYQRIFGTILGGIIAFGILTLVQNPFVISVLAILAMILGFAFTQVNYKVGATFVTIYVVFIFAMLTPNIRDLVQYRILDTIVGALLAFVANYLLWPSWEFLSIPTHLEKAIVANRDYLRQISNYYNKKGEVSISYRLARKEAFIEIGNLMASYQRMVQEPKSKQLQLPLIYKLAVLNHSLLSSSASLGTYIQAHKTTKASEAFNVVVNNAIKNLDDAIKDLNDQSVDPHQEDLKLRFTELRNIRSKELKESSLGETDFHLKMQEAQLVIEQLIWLTNLSQNIFKGTKTLTISLNSEV